MWRLPMTNRNRQSSRFPLLFSPIEFLFSDEQPTLPAAPFAHTPQQAGGKLVVFQSPSGSDEQLVGRLRHKPFHHDVRSQPFDEIDSQVDVFIDRVKVKILRCLGIFLRHAGVAYQLQLVQFQRGNRQLREPVGVSQHLFAALGVGDIALHADDAAFKGRIVCVEGDITDAESREQMLRHADRLSELPITSLKLHQLQLIRHTRMAQEYAQTPQDFHLYTVDEYIDLAIDFIERLRPDIVVERFVSQSPDELLIAPRWGLKNHEFTARLLRRMRERGSRQGRLFVGK